jgi:hypothetical protein
LKEEKALERKQELIAQGKKVEIRCFDYLMERHVDYEEYKRLTKVRSFDAVFRFFKKYEFNTVCEWLGIKDQFKPWLHEIIHFDRDANESS